MLSQSLILITDSQTVTTEAACLGVPVVRCNSWVGDNDMGNFIELEQKYKLIYSFNDSKKASEKVDELINKENLSIEWQNKKAHMLEEKEDMTEYLFSLIENMVKENE